MTMWLSYLKKIETFEDYLKCDTLTYLKMAFFVQSFFYQKIWDGYELGSSFPYARGKIYNVTLNLYSLISQTIK